MDLIVKEEELGKEIEGVFAEIMKTGQYVGGHFVDEFERAFASWVGTEHAISVSSGTDALKYILWALGIKKGDEVITPSLTFIATAETIALLGAKPVFVDVNPETFLIDPESVGKAVTERTKAILPVHIFGSVADMDRINAMAAKHGLAVIEDAAQAHGASYKGKKAGSLGLSAAFSFYPTKNLSVFGEAGAVTTDSREIADRITMLKNHGQKDSYYSVFLGENGRMDALQAGILLKKMKYIDSWNQKRRELASIYRERLSKVEEIKIQKIPEGVEPVYHLFVVLHQERDRLKEELKRMGIPSRIYYPVPLHLQPVFSYLKCNRGCLPNTERISSQLLALPIGPWMSKEDVLNVCKAVKKAVINLK